MIFRILGIFVTLFLIAACSSDDARLRDLYDVGTGPEEFAVLPSKPLIIPSNLKELPVPDETIGNLADPTPKRDLIEKLGGSIDETKSVPKQDKGLLNYVSRAGVNPNIREELAEEDQKFLRRMGVFLLLLMLLLQLKQRMLTLFLNFLNSLQVSFKFTFLFSIN